MSDNIVSLHKPPMQEDIIRGLRNLADKLEQEGAEAYDMPVVSTVVVVMGHSEVKPAEDGDLAHTTWLETFAWGPRCDIFTMRGLLVSATKL
jgi:hypothetical protein